MNLKKYNHSIIITSSNNKEYLLKSYNDSEILDIKFITKEELFKKIYFDYDFDSILALSKFGFTYSQSEEILKVIYNFNDSTNNEYKKYYDYLKNGGFLVLDNQFKTLLENKKIYIYNYSSLDDELLSSLKSLNLNYEFINDERRRYNHSYFPFIDVEYEVVFVFNKIVELLKKGISANKIYIYRYDDLYDTFIDKYKKILGIKIENKKKKVLKDSPIFISFKKYYQEENSFDEIFDKLNEDYPYDRFKAKDKLIDLINKLSFIEDKNIFLSLLEYKAKSINLSEIKYDNEIKLIDSSYILNEDDYCFILGFNINTYPQKFKDIGIINDENKKLLNQNTSWLKSEIAKEKLIEFIMHSKNLIITYAKNFKLKPFAKCLLIDYLNMKEEKADEENIFYNIKLLEIASCKDKDLYRKYGEKNKCLNTFSNEELGYLNYNHSFKPFDFHVNNFSVSYSNINKYYHCPFSFFASAILHLDEFEETFDSLLGTFVHKILQDSLTTNINLDDYKEQIDKIFVTPKDKYFVNIYFGTMNDLVSFNKNFQNDTYYKKIELEKKIYHKLNDKYYLSGSIDKLLIDETTKSFLIFDYKTYDALLNFSQIEYGFNMQLPIYMYLVSSSMPDYKVKGAYYEKVLEKDLQKGQSDYLYFGLTIKSKEEINRIDKNFQQSGNSNYFDGFQLTKAGEFNGRNKKLIQDDDFKQLIDIAKNKIYEAIDNIDQCKFEIAPKIINDFNSPCSTCSFGDVCFKNNLDKVYLKERV